MDLKKILKSKRGFTLIEMIAVLALMAIIGTLILQLVLAGTQQYGITTKKITGREDATLALNYILNELKRVDKESTPDGIEVLNNNTLVIRGNFNIIDSNGSTVNFNQQRIHVGNNRCQLTYKDTGDPNKGYTEDLTMNGKITSLFFDIINDQVIIDIYYDGGQLTGHYVLRSKLF